MIKKVLVVDDDRDVLVSLKEGLEKYRDTFSVMTAGDGLSAVEKLRKEAVSLIVTDLKMPGMDGFSLLSHISTTYPDIPVIVITGYGSPEVEKSIRKEGATAVLGKPFLPEDLARKILIAFRRESEGGTLHGVSSGTFLQLIEMEQKTCTIRLTDRSANRRGVLFFRGGELLNARLNGLQGLEAALEIFSWDEVNLSIQNDCVLTERKIQSDLQAIILEAMRLKDEAHGPGEQESTGDEGSSDKTLGRHSGKWNTDEEIKSLLANSLGERCGLLEIQRQDAWDGLLAQMTRVGAFFDSGRLELVYMDRGEPNDFILLPGKGTFVLSVSPKCARDRIIQVLTDR